MSGIKDQKPIVEFTENVENQHQKPVDHILVDADGLVQRLPVPSKDPNDPLNYSLKEKASIIVSCCWFCELFRRLEDVAPGYILLIMVFT